MKHAAAILFVLLTPFWAGSSIAQNMPLLVQLAKDSQWQQMATLLRDGLDPNASYGDGTTALHWAAYHDSVEATELLLEVDADVNATTDLGVTPLWLAVENGSSAVTSALLSKGADPNIRLLSGESIVMTAARTGEGDVVRAVLSAGADPNGAATREQTALMWAANRGHGEAVAALIEHGADIHARSLIREQYVKSEKEQDSSDVYKHWVQQGGNTALMFAARSGDKASAQYLVEAGARINEVNAFGTSPLIMAVHSGDLALIEYLIENGAELDQDNSGHTALHSAVLRGELAAVELLVAAGANLEALVTKPTPVRRQSTDYNFHDALIGSTPLWLAARFAEPAIMQTLIDAGADVNAKNHVVYPAQRMGENFTVDEGEISLLMAAAGMGHRRLRISWWTPERRARQLGKTREEFILEAVTVAVNAGIDPGLKNAEGDTVLAFARQRRYESVVAYLEAIGASE